MGNHSKVFPSKEHDAQVVASQALLLLKSPKIVMGPEGIDVPVELAEAALNLAASLKAEAGAHGLSTGKLTFSAGSISINGFSKLTTDAQSDLVGADLQDAAKRTVEDLSRSADALLKGDPLNSIPKPHQKAIIGLVDAQEKAEVTTASGLPKIPGVTRDLLHIVKGQKNPKEKKISERIVYTDLFGVFYILESGARVFAGEVDKNREGTTLVAIVKKRGDVRISEYDLVDEIDEE